MTQKCVNLDKRCGIGFYHRVGTTSGRDAEIGTTSDIIPKKRGKGNATAGIKKGFACPKH